MATAAIAIVLMLVAAHGVILLASFTFERRKAVFWRLHLPSALLAWAAYLAYEGWYIPRNCTGECNIRVDLVLMWPYLAFITVCALVAFARSRKGPRR